MFKSLAPLIGAFLILTACQTTGHVPITTAPSQYVGKVIPGRMFCEKDAIDKVVEGDKVSNAAAEYAIKKLLDQRKCVGFPKHIPVIIKTVEYKYRDFSGDEILVIGVVPAVAPDNPQKYMLLLARRKTNANDWREPGIEYRQA